MKAETYLLSDRQGDSNEYYTTVTEFSLEVLERAKTNFLPEMKNYIGFLKEEKLDDEFSYEECTIELLALGILWNNYIENAVELNKISYWILSKVTSARQKFSSLKKYIDIIKGVLLTLLLSMRESNHLDLKEFSPSKLKKLLNWLNATGEYTYYEYRLNRWKSFFDTMPTDDVNALFRKVIDFADWFDSGSSFILGKYTSNVEQFLREKKDQHRWKEDFVFCSRKPIEYHLNMVGAELMNQAFRERFLKTERKAILLPICMREKKDRCKAIKSTNGIICNNCTPNCRVSQLTQLGKKYNFEVYIIPHESSDFPKNMSKNGLGIIGVACVTNLLSGGWKATSLGMEAQCVLLNYCGCKKHWHDSGIVTDIDISRLKKLLEIDNE